MPVLLQTAERKTAPSQGQGGKVAHDRERCTQHGDQSMPVPPSSVTDLGPFSGGHAQDTAIWGKNTLHAHCVYLKSNDALPHQISLYNIGFRVLAGKGFHVI